MPPRLAPLPSTDPLPLRAMLPDELAARFEASAMTTSQARRIIAAVVDRFGEDLSDVRGVPRRLLDEVAATMRLATPLVIDRQEARDGFVKYALELRDGAVVEAVWMPLLEPRASVCISSQVGCPLACAFCMTGRSGFVRNLDADEMVGEVLRIRAESPRPVRSVVFMGMGEPLLNYDAVIRAAHILSMPGGGNISTKNITIGTAGVVPAIRRYTEEGHPFRLIVSLTAATSAKRARLMPHEKTWPLDELARALRAHAAATGDRVTVAWVMVSGVNTSHEDAQELSSLLRDVPVKIDLIDVVDPTGRFVPPGDDERNVFRDALTEHLGQPVTRRYSGGQEIGAACGMLAGRHGKETPSLPDDGVCPGFTRTDDGHVVADSS